MPTYYKSRFLAFLPSRSYPRKNLAQKREARGLPSPGTAAGQRAVPQRRQAQGWEEARDASSAPSLTPSTPRAPGAAPAGCRVAEQGWPGATCHVLIHWAQRHGQRDADAPRLSARPGPDAPWHRAGCEGILPVALCQEGPSSWAWGTPTRRHPTQPGRSTPSAR